MASINISYIPNLDLDQIESIFQEKLPKYRTTQVHRLRNWVCVRRNAFVSANFFIKHQPQKGITKITYNGNCDAWVVIFIGALWHYVVRGKFMTEVRESLKRGLWERYPGIQFYK